MPSDCAVCVWLIEPFDVEPPDIDPPDIEPFDIDPFEVEPPFMDPPLIEPPEEGALVELSGAVVWSVAVVPVGDPLVVGSVCGAVAGEPDWPEGAVVCASAGAAIAAAAASRMSFMGYLRD